ncbi:MAG: hypothetical protein IJ630_06715 [Treponema sp.]|nr:hypothetical protein [Treponema sp.]
MKILKKLAISALFMGSISFSFAVDYESLAKALDSGSLQSTISSGLNDFGDELGFSVPQAAVQQNVYADAFIGKLFPAVPPHFAVGINAGLTHLNTEGLKNAASALGISGVESSYYFPVFNADLRVGGVLLPFDVGLSFMTLDVSKLASMKADFTAEFFTLAADIRYAILEGGVISPALSVGVGYSYNKGTFGASENYAEVMVDYDVHTLYGQIQLSKGINIPVANIGFTPFVGLRGVISNYSNDWSWKFKGSGVEEITKAATDLGKTISTSGSGTASSDGFGGFQPQLYGGVGFNFALLQFTASVCADLRHLGGDTNLWSGVLSLRLKL